MAEHIIYILYSELFGSSPTEDQLSSLVASFQKLPTFAFLTMCNMFLSLFYKRDENLEVQRRLFQNLVDDEIERLAKLKLSRESIVKRPMFHRQQLLTLMKRVLLESPDNYGNDSNEDRQARSQLGRACLMINDFLISTDQVARLTGEVKSEEDWNNRLDELFAQWLPVAELMNPPDIFHAIARSDEYFKIFEQEFSNVTFSNGQNLTEFFSHTNGVTIKNYLRLIYCVFAWYYTKDLSELEGDTANFNINRATFFSNMQIPEEEINSFFKMNSLDLAGLSQEIQKPLTKIPLIPQYNLVAFRTYPLVFLSDNVVTCVDASFLIEKLASGIYHAIFNSLPRQGIDRNEFFKHWGKVFEKYVDQILRQVYPPLSGRLYSFQDFEKVKTKQEGLDGVIDSGDSLIVMEYKGGFLKAEAKYSGDIGILSDDLEKKFGCGERGAGIEQLARKLEMLFNKDPKERKTFSNFDVSRIKKVYPVLIVQDLSLQIGLANNKLRRIFEEEKESHNIDPSLIVRPLSLLTIEKLENLLPYLDAGDFTFVDILEEYTTGSYEPLDSFHNVLYYYREKKKIPHRVNNWIREKHDQILDSIKKQISEAPQKDGNPEVW
jgi:hypothetical protein